MIEVNASSEKAWHPNVVNGVEDNVIPSLTNGSTNGTPHMDCNGEASEGEAIQLSSDGHNNKGLEPIAVIGMALKFPQDATSVEPFWQMLLDGRTAKTEVPKARLNIDAYYHPDPKHIGTTNVKGGHFMEDDIESFDAPFFSMSPMEAASLDPQQRFLLEVTYQALENAGIPLDKAMGSNTSVHVGAYLHEHELLLTRDPEHNVKYKNTGVLQALLSNRLSWFYNFTGQSMTLAKIYGQENPPWGEGIGVLLLKTLSQALQDKDTIRGLVRASGLNQDGRTSSGITQPNPVAQAKLIHDVYKSADLDISKTRYFEAHGTGKAPSLFRVQILRPDLGTRLGDVLETRALSSAFAGRKLKEPLIVGAVKPNIGHLESASAMTGLIKTLLVLERGLVPPNINFEKLNPEIKADEWNLQFPLEVTSWPSKGLRRASVNSFGLGGANSHAVLDDGYHYLKERNISGKHRTCLTRGCKSLVHGTSPDSANGTALNSESKTKQPHLYVWSTSDEDGASRCSNEYQRHFDQVGKEETGSGYLEDLAFTLSERRTHFPWRFYAIASSLDELKSRLPLSSPKPIRTREARLTFVFTGQGAQWYAMARELTNYAVFDSSIEAADQQLNRVKRLLDHDNIFTRSLSVNVAYHSDYMAPGAPEYRECLGEIDPGSCVGESPIMVSSVTGRVISHLDLQNSEYWVQNLVSKVNFAGALSELLPLTDDQFNTFLEIGPHAALRSSVREAIDSINKSQTYHYSSVLFRGVSALETTLEAMGNLHSLGFSLRLLRVNNLPDADDLNLLIDLPPYSFNHSKKYWEESRLSRNTRFRKYPRHNLLGSSVPDWNPLQAKWRNFLQIADNPWIAGHKVNGLDVCPAAGMIVMAIEAVCQVSDDVNLIRGYNFREVTFSKALTTSSESRSPEVEIEFYLRRLGQDDNKSPTWHEFFLYMLEVGEWVECCRGSISLDFESKTDGGKTSTQDYVTGKSFSISQDIGHFEGHSESIDGHTMYTYLDTIGLGYGPSFQGLNDIESYGSGRITAIADLRHWEKIFPDGHLASHVVHPSALDLVFQLLPPAISGGCKKPMSTIVPARLDSLWVSESLRLAPDQRVQIRTRAEMEGLRNAKSCAVAVSIGDGLPCIAGKWNATSIASLESTPEGDSHETRLCYKIITMPDPELSENADIKAWCSSPENEYRPDDSIIAKRTQICHMAMSEALTVLSDRDIKSDRTELRHYVKWMEHQLTKAHKSGIRTDYEKDSGSLRSLTKEVASSGAEGRLIARVAENLLPILGGELDALDLLFQDNLAEVMYSEGLGIQHVFRQTASLVDMLANKNPDLQILEVGAGTGSGTSRVLEALANHPGARSGIMRFAEYTFTDISPGFLERGKDKFSDYNGQMTYAMLDIEVDPIQQGFTSDYDMVLALNVVHATSSPKNALANARKLLKPGGKLIMIEVTGPDQMQIEFIFGLLPGWWLHTESPREHSPLMSESDWHSRLTESGFSGVDFALRNHDSLEYHTYSAMVSTAIQGASERPHPVRIDLIINDRSAVQADLARQLKQRLRDDGDVCESVSLEAAANHCAVRSNFILLLEIDEPLISEISDEDFQNLQKLLASAQNLLWVAKCTMDDPTTALVGALQRTYRAENENLGFDTFMLPDGFPKPSTAPNIVKVLRNMLRGTPRLAETEYSERSGIIHINRVVESGIVNDLVPLGVDSRKKGYRKLGQTSTRPLALGIGVPGLLNTLQFGDDTGITSESLGEDEVEISINTAGVNFRDILTSLGQVNDDVLGLEGAGLVVHAGINTGLAIGDRVFGLLLGSYRTNARCNAKLICKIPQNLDFKTAAALPLVFCTAYHAVINLARLQPGESILVHSGAGGLGQAAIQLAQLQGAEIYASVGSEEKKRLLMDLYNIRENRIFSSRSTSFAQSIQRLTDGRGIDVIINSLAGEGLRASWQCIASFGRFIEVGRKDIDSFAALPMSQFAKNAMFTAVDLVKIMREAPDTAKHLMNSIVELAAANKIFVPTPLQVHGVGQTEDAFRHMQSGKSMGKLVIEFRAEDTIMTLPSVPPICNLRPDATYLIAGGLGGLGRTVARWMVSRGARFLLLLSSSKKQNREIDGFLADLTSDGVTFATPVCDISNKNALASVLDECNQKMPPVRGCIQAVMVLKDAQFNTMPKTSYDAVTRPKIAGSHNLHTLLPTNLDFFIFFSSLAGIAPSFGQTNYAIGNAYMDNLARHRTSLGLKAVSLSFAMVVNAGYVAETEGLAGQLEARGSTKVYVEDILALLDYYCDPQLPVLPPDESQVIIGLQTRAALKAQGVEEPFWLQRPLFRYLTCTQASTSSTAGHHSSRTTVELDARLAQASSLEQAAALVQEALVKKMARILVMEEKDVDVGKPVHAHGVDSLVAMELRQWFRNALRADVPVLEILGEVDV
ncbi:MAG: hypothetical protein Q9195_009231, partial [Heterodermia aff. obscurata]